MISQSNITFLCLTEQGLKFKFSYWGRQNSQFSYNIQKFLKLRNWSVWPALKYWSLSNLAPERGERSAPVCLRSLHTLIIELYLTAFETELKSHTINTVLWLSYRTFKICREFVSIKSDLCHLCVQCIVTSPVFAYCCLNTDLDIWNYPIHRLFRLKKK